MKITIFLQVPKRCHSDYEISLMHLGWPQCSDEQVPIRKVIGLADYSKSYGLICMKIYQRSALAQLQCD